MKTNTRLIFLTLALVAVAFTISRFRAPKPQVTPSGSTSQSSQSQSSSNQEVASLSPTPEKEDQKKDSRRPAQTLQKASTLEDFFKKNFKGDWIFDRNDQGLVIGITGDLIPEWGKSEDSALAFGMELLPYISPDPTQSSTLVPTNHAPSDLSTAYHFDQKYQGLEVYLGKLTLVARNSDGAIYTVATTIRPIGQISLTPRISAADARGIVTQKYSSKGIQRISDGVLVVYALAGPAKAEVAWKIGVSTTRPQFMETEVLVGGQSGMIVNESPLLIH